MFSNSTPQNTSNAENLTHVSKLKSIKKIRKWCWDLLLMGRLRSGRLI